MKNKIMGGKIMNGLCMPSEESRDYKEEYREMAKENHYLKVIIKLLYKKLII